MTLLFSDVHLHTNPVKGLGAHSVSLKFKESGGWFMAIVALPPYHYDIPGYPSPQAYAKLLDLVVRECRAAREKGIVTACLMGLHPAEIDRMEQLGLKPDDIVRLVDSITPIYERACKEGLIEGIGEIGRQHYKTLPHRLALAEYAMLRLAEVAKDYDCIVHLHLENEGEATVKTIANLLGLIGINKSRVLFHHATVNVALHAINMGFNASIPGRRDAILKALRVVGPRFLVESDYIDDPKRPCVAQCPWNMVAEEKELLEKGLVGDDELARINVDNVARFYNVSPP